MNSGFMDTYPFFHLVVVVTMLDGFLSTDPLHMGTLVRFYLDASFLYEFYRHTSHSLAHTFLYIWVTDILFLDTFLSVL